MKTIKAVLVLAALAGAFASAPVFADRGRGHHFRGHHHHHHRSHARIGVFIGAPLVFSPWYYYPPRYYYPPAVVVHTPPPVYVEQGQAAAASQDDYWYYCRESQTYYPHVKECAGPWQRVIPQAPSS
jgi:hypothetical protein